MKISKVTNVIEGWFVDWRAYIVEFLGTFFFVFISCAIVLVDHFYGGIGILGKALAIGFCYSALIFMTVQLSGGYLNPAITIALWLVQKLSGVKTTFFLLTQIAASFSAGGAAMLIFGDLAREATLGAPVLGLNVSLSQAVLIEAIFTAIIVFAVFTTMIDRRGPVSFGPLVLGIMLVSLSLVAMPVSGAGLNPARVLGPLVLSNSTNTLAVWLIGPITGSLFGVIYDLVFLKKSKK
ncbi:hypothetical protein A2164_02225 [Candidatus Curtissbacteria bacterium RBG_13_35_7]|uniref:Aquaporin n=1 Tax=Candidatus Curtissbacteria bacterium RBG_13_35_7 TaxID=1797705 RepID=A0A1F5G177_9BACT|nr:MAG: hypothetical protein A2164_02225 [Candidatus Curtissbacteria bacterium RBG_13_35_7]